MTELTALSALETLLPVSVGDTSLVDATPLFITSIMPGAGKAEALKSALLDAHGLRLPAVGRTSGKAGLRLIWTGQGQYFLCGEKPAGAKIAKCAALSDQSDAWAVMALDGPDAREVLARLCPLDLRAHVFKRGHCARSELAHMMSVISRSPKGFEIMVMRSFAQTAVHHIATAMTSVEAQTRLPG